MNCLPCFNKDDDDEGVVHSKPTPAPAKAAAAPPPDPASSKAKAFNFRELAMATRNFRKECLIGEGLFGRVFKGTLQATGQVVAVKQLDRNGMQESKDFLDEVLRLSLLEHPNLVSLIGYCADGDQRLMVYEFMEMGSLEKHLFGDDPEKKLIDWYTRMKIASSAATGLEYMHDTTNPPMIYRDFKPSNILLDESYEPKLSDYGLATLGVGGGDNTNPTSSRVMGTYGYSAPEYSSTGELTLKSDIYSFGVVLLELIAGRRAIDTNKPNDEQNLVTWAKPIFREPKRFPELADPRLNKEFPVRGLNQAVGICAMCLQEESSVRPLAADVVAALSFLSMPLPNDVLASSLPQEEETKTFTPPPQQKMEYDKEVSLKRADKDGSSEEDDDDGSSEESEEEENDAEDDDNARRESSQFSVRHNIDQNDSEKESEYSDSDNADESDHDDDSDSSKHKNQGNSTSKKTMSDSDNADESDRDDDSDSSNHKNQGNSSRNSDVSSKKSSSELRKTVKTFKEPTSSSSSGSDSDSDGEDKRKSSSSKKSSAEPRKTVKTFKAPSSSSSSGSDSDSDGEDKPKSSSSKKSSSEPRKTVKTFKEPSSSSSSGSDSDSDGEDKRKSSPEKPTENRRMSVDMAGSRRENNEGRKLQHLNSM